MVAMKNIYNMPKQYLDPKRAKIALVPVPYDGTSTYGKGADRGPAALLDAAYYVEQYDIETKTEVYRQGIYVEKPVTEKRSPEAMTKAVEARVSSVIDKGKFCVLLGGEHSVTPGAVFAHAKKYRDLTVLQLDAHTDMRDELFGSRWNHGCVMARVQEVCPVVQVGIRSMDKGEWKNIKKDRIFFAKDIHDNDRWMNKAVSKLSKNVYLTFDLDVFDPAFVPSTGTPEPGGLGWYRILKFLRLVNKSRNIVGFDVVELLPRKDNPASDFHAAKLVYTILSYKFGEKIR